MKVGYTENPPLRMVEDRLILNEILATANKQPHSWILQQDSDPKHASKFSQKWFSDHKIKLLRWQWDELKRRVQKRRPWRN